MTDNLERLAYLREPTLMAFSAEVFGSSSRLPVLGAIFELTPNIEEDRFYGREVMGLLRVDPGNTHRELQRSIKCNLLTTYDAPKGTSGKILLMGRLASPRWTIIETALGVARAELDI